MTIARTLLLTLLLAAVTIPVAAQAPPQRPYHNGPVWDIGFIRMKAGMESAYLTYIANDWKREQEALKKAGLVLDYRVLQTDAHGTQDWNLMLMTQYKDMATLEANVERMEQVAMQALGQDDTKMRQGYRDRMEIREVMGGRLAREIILTPRTR